MIGPCGGGAPLTLRNRAGGSSASVLTRRRRGRRSWRAGCAAVLSALAALGGYAPGAWGEEVCGGVTADDSGTPGFLFHAVYGYAISIYEFLDEPGACLVCQLLGNVVVLFEEIGVIAFEALAPAVTNLMLAGAAMYVAFLAGRRIFGMSGDDAGRGWSEQIVSGVRFLIASVVLTTASYGADAGTMFRGLYDGMIGPVVNLSVLAGTELLVAVGSSGGAFGSVMLRELDAETEAMIAGLPDGDPAKESTLVAGVMRLAAGLHMVGRLGLAQGVGFIGDAAQTGSSVDATAWVGGAIGVLILMSFVVFVALVGLRLVDPLLRAAVVLALSPLLIAAWCFPVFRQAAVTGARTLAYCCLYFVVAGVVYLVAFELIMAVQRPVDAGSFDAVARSLLCAGERLTEHDGQFRVDVPLAVLTLVSVMLAHSLIGVVGQIAGMLTDYRSDEGIAGAAEGEARGIGTKSMMVAGYAAATVASSMGRGAFGWLKNFFKG